VVLVSGLAPRTSPYLAYHIEAGLSVASQQISTPTIEIETLDEVSNYILPERYMRLQIIARYESMEMHAPPSNPL